MQIKNVLSILLSILCLQPVMISAKDSKSSAAQTSIDIEKTLDAIEKDEAEAKKPIRMIWKILGVIGGSCSYHRS